MDSTTPMTPPTAVRGGRGSRVLDKPSAAEKQQARAVSLRRIARLFRPYRWSVLVVVAIIAASSVAGLASPFLLRGVIDNALPRRDVSLLVLLTAGMVAVAAVTSVLGVVQTWISTKVGQQVMHSLRPVSSPTSSASRSAFSPGPAQVRSSPASPTTSAACSRWSPRPPPRSPPT